MNEKDLAKYSVGDIVKVKYKYGWSTGYHDVGIATNHTTFEIVGYISKLYKDGLDVTPGNPATTKKAIKRVKGGGVPKILKQEEGICLDDIVEMTKLPQPRGKQPVMKKRKR